jgi:DNA-binding NarL/FixJ family response regulator
VSCTVLIVDDNALVRRSLRACIEHGTDLQVCGEAENGQVAVEKVKELHPDIAILDLQMPVMNGLEAGRQISLVAPDTALVMFTMHTNDQLLKKARAAGFTQVLSKSVGIADQLLPSLKSLCHRR